ncbi:MAG: hypothetical protein IPO83_00855 [Chitinophagaceae bacterium]|nr:hypothetical protein [Chitinophagaceae bacterium]
MQIRNDAAYNINFHTNGSQRMTILGNTNPGFVGIGTTSPSSVLEVDASNYSTGEVVRTVAASGTNSYWRMFGVNSGTTYEFAALYRNNGSLDFQIQASYAASGGGALRFNTGGSNLRMIITGGGDVGIGTSGPNAKFEVVKAATYQQRLSYDAGHYTDIGTSSSGDLI